MKKILLILFLAVFACNKQQSAPTLPTTVAKSAVSAKQGMVVSARAEASQIGVEILKQGGNAFDAMMATEMALAVTFPFAGNLGGGGFLVFRLADGTKGALDYREKAPLLATKNMFLDSSGNVIPNKSTLGAYAVGVPGTVAGIFNAQKKYGKLSVEAVLKPVIKLAKEGFVVTEKQAKRFAEFDSIFKVANGKEILFNKNIKAGDVLKNPNLANTLQRISDNGMAEFYTGETAKVLVNFIKEKQGIVSLEDLKKYQPVWRNPVSFKYKNFNIISMSPPSSGGICLGQILKMIEPFDLKSYGQNSVKYIQVLTEAERRAYADRSFYLGDPDFVKVPQDVLLSDAYLKSRMANFSFDKATPSAEVSHGDITGYESNETTHYSIIDQFGNAIAVTTTLNGAYGSKLYVDELGFFLNNEMDDFAAKPGVPNMFGLIGAEANSIAPEKRMLSSMTPTIIEKDNKLLMSVGTPGGSTIITSVLQTVLNVLEFNMNMQEAVDAPRFHHQWLPDEVLFEPNGFDATILNTLKEKGYHIVEKSTLVIGKVEGILVLDDNTLQGGADKRGDDTAVGF